MYLPNPDLLQPIGQKNRPENILVPFARGIRNVNLSLFMNLLDETAKEPDLVKIFPGFLGMKDFTSEQIYAYTALFPNQFAMLEHLSQNQLSNNTAVEMIQIYQEPYRFNETPVCRLEYALSQLIFSGFLKNLYVCVDKVTTEIGAYLNQSLLKLTKDKRSSCQLHVMEGPILEVYEEHPELTTIFLNRAADFFQLQSQNPDSIQGKCFVIIDNVDDMGETIGENTLHKHLETFQRLLDQKICAVSYMYPYALGIGDTAAQTEIQTEGDDPNESDN